MANRYIRLTTSPSRREHVSIIGLSRSAAYADLVNDESWNQFFTEHAYAVREMQPHKRRDRRTIDALGAVSSRYFEIEPPIEDGHLDDLAQLCANQITTHGNAGYLIDHRETLLPLHESDMRGQTLAYW
jgi:hypothetical protein